MCSSDLAFHYNCNNKGVKEMPTIYMSKEAYDELIRLGEDPGRFAEEAINVRLYALREKLEAAKKATGPNNNSNKS